jgi:hypothetical protein
MAETPLLFAIGAPGRMRARVSIDPSTAGLYVSPGRRLAGEL